MDGPRVGRAWGRLRQGELAPQASWLAASNHVLAIDFRGCGRSVAGTDHRALFEDVSAALLYLHGRGVTRVAVLGASMGEAPPRKLPSGPPRRD